MTRAVVNYKERDLSLYIPSTQTIGAGLIVQANKGRRNKVLHITSKKQLLKLLTPNNSVEMGADKSIYSALTILDATKTLLVVIPKSKGSKLAGLKLYKDSQPVKSDGIEDLAGVEMTTESVVLAADNEGIWGNDLYVTIHGYKEDEKVTNLRVESEILKFDVEQKWGNGFPVKVFSTKLSEELDPNTTYFIRLENKVATLHEYQKDAFTGENPVKVRNVDSSVAFYVAPATQFTKFPNSYRLAVFNKYNLNDPLAVYTVSLDQTAKDLDGNSLDISSVINDAGLLNVKVNGAVGSQVLADVIVPAQLGGGDNGQPVTTGEMIRALRYFENTNEYQITFFGDGGYTVPAFQQKIEQLCRTRRDCFAVLSAPLSTQKNVDTAAQEAVNYRKYELNLNSSWAALYTPHLKIYDEFNDRDIWASPDGFAIRAMIESSSQYELWYPVAGNTRGIVNARDTKIHFTDGDQDLLYDNGINPIIFDNGQGIKIWGQKTLQVMPSKLDRIHVRMLMITIGPAITKALRNILFDINDEATRSKAYAIVTAYMDGILARRGITRYECVCDESNNSPEDLANNRLNLDLIVCPTSVVEEINFTTAIINEMISFELAKQAI